MKQEIGIKGKLKRLMTAPLLLTIVFAALNVGVYFLNIMAGMVCSIFVVIYLVVLLIVYTAQKKILLQSMIDFATRYGTVQKRLLDEFEVPYALLDGSGKLMWGNRSFREISGKESDYHKSITSVFSPITREVLDKVESERDISLVYDQKNYRVHLKRVYYEELIRESESMEQSAPGRYMTVAYFFDETLLTEYRIQNQNMQMVSALIYIDNFDEIMDKMEEMMQSMVLAYVDQKVNLYFSAIDGLVKKTDKDKYFVVFRYKYLDQLTKGKFSLLEDVKTIQTGTDMQITLSMGIGFVGNDYKNNYENSRMAIELALGRGGDQAVLKTLEKTSYFGGNGRQVDKTTRVKARVKALALRDIIVSKERLLIMGHKIADVDSLGAAIGIYCAARQLGKRAQIVLGDVSSSLRPFRDLFKEEQGYPKDMFINGSTAMDLINEKTAVIVVDTNRPGYTEYPQLLAVAKSIVVFDHHRQTEDGIRNTTLSYIEPYASSACEMIAEVLQYFDDDIKLSPSEADAIYGGILIDTNNFVSKTGVRTFEAAAYLRRCGAEVVRVRKMLRNDMAAYKARAIAVSNAEVFEQVFAISSCPSERVASPTIACAQAANELLNIIGIKASFVLTKYQDKIFVSARSIDEINVQRIMEQLGGGGHMNSAGAQLDGCTLQEGIDKIKAILREEMRKGETK